MKLLDNIKSKFTNISKSKLQKIQKDRFIKQVKFLKELSIFERRKFANLLIEKHYKSGDFIFREKYPHAVLYIIEKGSLEISVDSKKEKIVLANLKKGDYIGEIGLFIDSSRTANVVADGDCTLLAISKNSFKDFIERNPKIGIKILYTFGKKLSTDLITTNLLLEKYDV